MKIAIFENEYDSVKGAFEIANLLFFKKELILENFQKSQDANFSTIKDYSVIFIDIDLAARSELDGYGLIKKIIQFDSKLTNRLVILTGNNKIEEKLIERDIPQKQISIIIKPTDYKEISEVIKKILKANPQNQE